MAFNTKAELDLGGNKATNAADGTVATDLVTKSQLDAAGGGLTAATANSIAAGNVENLRQRLLVESGQAAKTVLAVGNTHWQGNTAPTTNHKAQIASLGDGNVVFVYATGAAFTAGTVQEGPIFLAKGEIYVVESIQNGSIITSTEGAYGYSQQRQGGNTAPMPLLSLGLSFSNTFCFGYRNSDSTQGKIWVVNGPIESSLTLLYGSGASAGDPVPNVSAVDQENLVLDPWEHRELDLDGNLEYQLKATNPVMACIAANMNFSNFYDSRLVMPLTSDGISWPYQGQVSALYASTETQHFVNDLCSAGTIATATVSPGSPADWDFVTGAGDVDYEPRGATRIKAAGLISAYSGADTAGVDATPFCPRSAMTYRLALPLRIENAGDGGNNGIAIASPYAGTARLYQWNAGTGVADLVTVDDPLSMATTDIAIVRRDGASDFTATTRAHQQFPASALVSAGDNNAHTFQTDFTGGYIEANVPITVVFNSNQNENGATGDTWRGTSGTAVAGITADDDECLTLGITPPEIAAEITEDTNGTLKRRNITAGVETWVMA